MGRSKSRKNLGWAHVTSTTISRACDGEFKTLVTCSCGWESKIAQYAENLAEWEARSARDAHLREVGALSHVDALRAAMHGRGRPKARRPNSLGGQFASRLGWVVLATLVVVSSVVFFSSRYERDGPDGTYTEIECINLKAAGLMDDNPDREDMLAEYAVHCE